MPKTKGPRAAIWKIRRLLDLDPELTYAQLAGYTGVSRQRAHQLVRKYRLKKVIIYGLGSRPCLGGCGKVVRSRNRSGFCRPCKKLSHSYEFRCSYCGEVQAVAGRDATNRRTNQGRKKSTLDFCNRSCGQLFYTEQRRRTHTETEESNDD